MDVPLVSSRITTVTAYRKGARVLRVADLKAENGAFPAQVRLTNLPLALDDGSLKICVSSINSTNVPIATDLRVSLETPPPDPALPPAEDPARRAARIECDKINDRIEQNRLELDRLHQISIPPRHVDTEAKALPPVPTEARLKLLDLRKERFEALLKEKDWLQLMKMDAERKLQDLEAKIARDSSARQAKEHELRKAVTVSLRPSGSAGAVAESAQLTLEYVVPGARWAPAYTFRFERDYSKAELSMRALVCQRTGEDWTNTKLILSTADVQNWTELPELNSLRIGRRQEHQPRRGWRPPPTGVEELFGDFDRYVRGHMKAASAAVATSRIETTVMAKSEFAGAGAPPPAPVAQAARGGIARSAAQTGELILEDIELMPTDDAAETQQVTLSGPPSSIGAGVAEGIMGRGAPAAAPMQPPMAVAPGSGRRASGVPSMSRVQRASRLRDEETRIEYRDTQLESDELRPADQLLNFGRLRMISRDAGGHGKLQPIPDDAIYAEILTQAKVEFTLNFKAAMTLSHTRARSVEDYSPPHRCRYPKAVDGFDYAYTSTAPVDIPSDGDFHSIPVAFESAESRSSFTCVPRESLDVYRYVEVKNPLGAPLLEGPADIYVGGDFLMTSPVETVPPYGRVRLGLGVEPAIKIARNTTYAEEAAGIIGGSLDLKHEIRIDVINHLPQPAAIEIRERIPVLREGEDQAKLTVTNVSPDWQELKPELLRPDEQDLKGAYRWSIQAPPGKPQQLRVMYTIQISAKNELSGGNRREG